MKNNLLLLIICCFTAFSPQITAQTIPTQDIMLSDYQYPFPVHLFKLHVQGQPLLMAYMDVQPSHPNGKTIVLLHGKNFCGAYWDSTATKLSNNGYRVIIPDQVGFGKSSKPTNLQRDRTALGKANAPEAARKTLGNYPELGKNAAKRIPHATLVLIEGVGHLPHIEAYTKFITPLLAFLKG